MKRKFAPLCASISLAFCSSAIAQQVAITEFFNNPSGLTDEVGEFVELFNYGGGPVNLNGWTISDEGTDNAEITTGDLMLPSGGYLIIAKNKAALEGAYFGALPQPEIIELPDLTLGNRGDEIILSNSESQVVWSLAYPDGESSGNATFLTEDSFATTVWGSEDFVGIDFDEIDPASGTLGYQANDNTEDPNATTTEAGDIASPLAGSYTAGSGPGGDSDVRILSIVPGSTAGTYDIAFSSETGQTYSIETSPDLNDGSFSVVDEESGTGLVTTVTVTAADGQMRGFFRIREMTVVIGR